MILNISKTGHGNQKTFMMSGKVGTSGNKMACAKGTFLWWKLCIPSFRTIAFIVDKQSGICRKHLLLQGLCVPSVKTTTYICNGFKMDFFFKFKWKVLKQTNYNLSKLSSGSILPQRDYEFENQTFIWIRILTTHLVYTTSLTDFLF